MSDQTTRNGGRPLELASPILAANLQLMQVDRLGQRLTCAIIDATRQRVSRLGSEALFVHRVIEFLGLEDTVALACTGRSIFGTISNASSQRLFWEPAHRYEFGRLAVPVALLYGTPENKNRLAGMSWRLLQLDVHSVYASRIKKRKTKTAQSSRMVPVSLKPWDGLPAWFMRRMAPYVPVVVCHAFRRGCQIPCVYTTRRMIK